MSLGELQAAYRACFSAENGDRAGRLAAQDYLNNSTAIYHGDVIGLGFIPKLYDQPALEYFDALASTTYRILEKVTRRFLEDGAYRALFGFSPTLERLICLPTGYATTIPIMRADLFLNEDDLDFSFCEFNTDGTSAMNEDREGANALMRSATFARAAQELGLEAQELFEGWVEGFFELYRSSEGAVERPTIAIVDYRASATPYEFEEFRARFERRGLRCLICDLSQLVYRDEALYGSDVNPAHPAFGRLTRIDALYRRAVTGEIVAELEADTGVGAASVEAAAGLNIGAIGAKAPGLRDEAAAAATADTGAHALVRAVEQRRVCMIGGFCTHVAHCKQLFTVLHLPETTAFLTEEETAFIRRHVPYTTRLSNRHIDLNALKTDKDRWIIKPEDGYGSKGVYAGVDQSQEDWNALIDECAERHYVVQSFCEQYATPNTRLTPLDERGKQRFATLDEWKRAEGPNAGGLGLESWNNLTGLYLYNGRFSGLFVRAGQTGIIAGFAGGITVPSFLAGYDSQAGLALRTAGSGIFGVAQ
jgi:hypothetical protein